MATQSRHTPMPPVLVTRPLGKAERFAEAIRTRFDLSVKIVVSPVSAPVFLAVEFPTRRFAGLIFTSETGVAAYKHLKLSPNLPAWCVGDETAAAARKVGFQTRSAQGNAEKLATLIEATGSAGPFLHFRGQEATGNLAGRLTSAAIETDELIVYAQQSLPLNEDAKLLLSAGLPVVIPIFSPKSADRLSDALSDAGLRPTLWVAAISPAAMSSARALQPARHAIAVKPNSDALLDAISDLFDADAQP
jgi:uroporphyrinogen-III synthase